MRNHRPFGQALDALRRADLRPTRQRLALARLLFEGGDRHVTAEQLHDEAMAADIPVSLATVYNTLAPIHRGRAAARGRRRPRPLLLRHQHVSDHHHFFHEATGHLAGYSWRAQVVVAALPQPPAGTSVRRVDVIVRLADRT